MSKISFTVSARTAQLIGQQNFSTAEGAIIELVKNCYDADAKNSIVLFDNANKDFKKHAIYIIDDGVGMTSDIIKNHWMMIGTDNKEYEFQTESGRIKTGAKGIGRFALDRLGEISEMITLPKKSNIGSYWKVNWNDFKKKGISISNVKADLKNLSNYNLKNRIISLAQDFEPMKSYIENINFTSGTIIKISSLKEKWDEDEIQKLFENLEILSPPKEQPVFKICLLAKNFPDEFGELSGAYFDDYDYKVTAKFLDDENRNIKIIIERDEFDLRKVEKNYMKVFKLPLMKVPPFDYESFKKKVRYNLTINELVKGISELDQDNIDKIGKFEFTFYFLKNTKSDERSEANTEKYPYKDFNSSSRRAWLKKFGGVKIFRDDFRVRPYGENGQDWLKLGERQAQSPQGAGQRIGAYRIRPNQISGTVSISRLTNINFEDKSGREGIQENEVFDLFKSILIGIINQFEKDRNIIMYSFSELQSITDNDAKKRAAEEAKRVLEEEEEKKKNKNSPKENNESSSDKENYSDGPSETEIALAKGFQANQEEIDSKDNEIRLLRSLSGIGLIVASFAHELRSLRTLLNSRTNDLKIILKNLITKDLKNLPEEDNPFIMLDHMREQDIQIKHWLDYSLSALKKDKRTRTDLNVSDYFKSFESNWDKALKRRKVKLNVINNLKRVVKIRAFAIDFDTVFNNLLINSLDSFKRRSDEHKRIVNVKFEAGKEILKIYFSDNGLGLSKDFQNKPNDIFLPFETSKINRKGEKIGTGLGMYLTKTIIDDYKGEMEILEFRDGFKVGMYIPLRKTKNQDEEI